MTLFLPGNRPYQTQAITAPFERWSKGAGNGLIVLPTGTGKSRVLAGIAHYAINGYPQLDPRILALTHLEELIDQNTAEMRELWPEADVGIYSAGLKQRQTANRIVMGGVHSLFRNATIVGRRDILIIDEVHLLSHKDSGMYRKTIKQLLTLNPNLRIVGLTATPYRLDSGMLTDPWKGVGPMFAEIFFDYDIVDAMNEGYLTRLSTKSPPKLRLDTSGVGTSGGEFKPGELQAKVNVASINERIVADALERATGRGKLLVFTTGIEHMEAFAAILSHRGVETVVLHGELSKGENGERKSVINGFKHGSARAMVSVRVATTGLNVPNIDCIIDIAPTKSKGLHIQKNGRGTRNVYAPGMPLDTAEERLAAIAAGPKPDCLVLDYAGNITDHGPIDEIDGSKSEGGVGKPPMKDCPECDESIHASKTKCPACGYQFPKIEPKYRDRPVDAPITSDQQSNVWLNVTKVFYHVHFKASAPEGTPPSFRMQHICGLRDEVNVYLPFDADKPGAQFMARKRWTDRYPGALVPETVTDPQTGEVIKYAAEIALEASSGLRQPGRILARRAGKYWEFIAADFSVPPGIKQKIEESV